MRIAVALIATLLTTSVAHADLRSSRGRDVTLAPRTRTPTERADLTLHRVPPPAPPPGEVSVLGSLLGAVALLALGAGYVMPRGGRGGGSRGGGRGIFGSHRSGYAALTPSFKRVREVSIAPTVTPDGLHGGVSLRW